MNRAAGEQHMAIKIKHYTYEPSPECFRGEQHMTFKN